MKTVAIVPGWAEGSWQSRKLAQELAAAGFKVTDKIEQADIIIAHSLGCYMLPRDIKNKTILLIGLPFWPNRSTIYSLMAKLRNELKYHRKNKNFGWWLNKLSHNCWYLINNPMLRYIGYGFSKLSSTSLPDGTRNKVLLVRPADDTFCHPDVQKLLPIAEDYNFKQLAGAHDDCWFKPQPYIDLLLKEI